MTPAEWTRKIEAGATAFELAKMLQADLKGYRQTSLSRAVDLDNITSLLQAIQQVKQ
jgi:hypothetical protein